MKANEIALGGDVYLDGVKWSVWSPAPGRGQWWLIRYDDDGKCHTTQAASVDLEHPQVRNLKAAKRAKARAR